VATRGLAAITDSAAGGKSENEIVGVKVMNRSVFLVFCLAMLAGCQEAADGSGAAITTGQDAYEIVCSTCHADGKDGAPRTDHPEDWDGRSTLWQAILIEHAKRGYMDMPAKGGDGTLSDEVVAAAAEYMLERTQAGIPSD
jgi:cytochrome c5